MSSPGKPLAAATACGPGRQRRGRAGQDPRRARMGAATWSPRRSATLAQTGHSVFQPTPDDPAYVLMVDEGSTTGGGLQRARIRADAGVPGLPNSGKSAVWPDPGPRSGATQKADRRRAMGPARNLSQGGHRQHQPGHRNPGTATGAESGDPRQSASTPAAGRASSRSGTPPRRRRSPRRGAHNSCSGCRRTSSPTAKRIVDARQGGARRVLPGPRPWSWGAPRGHAPGERVPGGACFPGAAAPGRDAERCGQGWRAAQGAQRGDTLLPLSVPCGMDRDAPWPRGHSAR